MSNKLEAREALLLEFAYRCGMALPELAGFISEIPHELEAAKLLEQLSTKGYLGRAPLDAERSYYFLAENAHREFELARDEIGPLKEQEKVARLGMLSYCLKHDCRPLTPADFKHSFPQLVGAHPHGPQAVKNHTPRFRDYYLTSQTLGLLLIDLGGAGRWDRVLGRSRRKIAKHLSMPGYAELISRGAFQLTVATAFEKKAARLRAAIEEHPAAAPVAVTVVPALRYFIVPPASHRPPASPFPQLQQNSR